MRSLRALHPQICQHTSLAPRINYVPRTALSTLAAGRAAPAGLGVYEAYASPALRENERTFTFRWAAEARRAFPTLVLVVHASGVQEAHRVQQQASLEEEVTLVVDPGGTHRSWYFVRGIPVHPGSSS